MAKTKRVWRNILSITVNVLFVVFMLAGSTLIFHNLYFTPVKIIGTSMTPTLSNNDFGVMDTHEAAKKKLSRFDIIIINYPLGSDYFIIKRVIGLPGETVTVDMTTGALTIDEAAVDQPFITAAAQADTCRTSVGVACGNTVTLTSDQYYVLGDHRAVSKDSEHGVGLVSYSQIKGVLFAIEGTCQEDTTSTSEGAHLATCSVRTYRWPTFY